MNASLFKGGTPRIRYMWCEDDRAEFMPPFSAPNMDRTPPYDAHVDGAYGSGRNYFTLGMPFRPNLVGMEWQRKAIRNAHLQVDDIIRLIVVPEDHFVTALNFKIVETDARIAGSPLPPRPSPSTPLVNPCTRKSTTWKTLWRHRPWLLPFPLTSRTTPSFLS